MKPTKELRVMLGILDAGMWHSAFGKALCNLEVAFRNFRVGDYERQQLRTLVTTGSVLPKSRLHTLKEAKRFGADYLLFIDSDQTFPRRTLHLLISRGVDVIGANIPLKTIPSVPSARYRPPPGELLGRPVYTGPDSTGIEEVWRVGTGLLMLSRRVIEALPHSCFEMRYVPALDDYQGEDWSLCEAIEAAGFKIYVDHDLSKEVGHVGLLEYTHELVVREELKEAANG